jgi:hypothetical protein
MSGKSKGSSKRQAKALQSDGSVKTTDQETGVVTVEAPSAPKVKPSFRGTSTVSAPVNRTWLIADRMATEAKAAGKPAPKRTEVVNACRAAGITYYTARTQYQAWFSHTLRGAKLISEGNAIPERKQRALPPANLIDEE